MTTSLDDILYGLAEECGVINKDISEARQAIVEAVEGLIGEDEPNPRNGSEWEYGFEYRNKLRAGLRQKLTLWMDGNDR